MIEHDENFERCAEMWGFNTEKKDGFFVSFETHKAWCMYQHGIKVGESNSTKEIQRLEDKLLRVWVVSPSLVKGGG